MYYRMTEIRKITNQKLGAEDKMAMFRWIAAHGEHTTSVAGGI